MSGFYCQKQKRQMTEPCAWCEDCPGDVVVEHLVTFMTLDADQVTEELEAELAGAGWERI